MKNLNQIATTFRESIFSEISRTARENNAVNLSQGFPNFSAPEWLLEFGREALNENHLNQYSPSNGNNALVHQLSEYYKRLYDLDYHSSEITVTAGCTEALFCAASAVLNPGDEVLLFEPFYDSYHAISELAGAKINYITLKKPKFEITASEIEKQITDKTKLIFLNNPHNPTGRVFSKDELQIIADLAIKHDLYVISDEVYEHLVFDNRKHIPIATLDGMKERTFTLSSLGKTFGVTGWKIGWACGPEAMTKALRNIHQFTTFCANHPFQFAAAKAIEKIDSYLPEFRNLYEQKKILFVGALKNAEFNIISPEGTYFAMAELPEGKNDVDYCLELIKNKSVAAIPPSAFYRNSNEGERMLRFCFAKDNDTLNAAIESLIQ